jgi:tmRNA-binding protein
MALPKRFPDREEIAIIGIVEIALGRGKDKGDKRRAIADRDAKRQMDRELKARR